MGRFFNTSGPCVPEDHYIINPLARLEGVRSLIEHKKYFILHAPRQTGKTTTVIAFMKAINVEGRFIALYVNVEAAQAVRDDVVAANRAFVSAIERSAEYYLPAEYRPSPNCSSALRWEEGLSTFLTRWCTELPKPLVLFLDEADALIGDSLLSLLRQLRSSYHQRPSGFPQSVALVGLRDIRDYRIYSEGEKRYVIGGSAFNIKDKSLTMGNFTPEQVQELYAQHTSDTGQQFSEAALSMIYEQTQGQPWLVNALGRELCFEENKVPPDRIVTPDDVYRAIETLIQRRDTHLDHLADKLSEPRVARVIDIILSGGGLSNLGMIPKDDLQYVLDLGLVARTDEGIGIANPIYREVIPREITYVEQAFMRSERAWYVNDSGRLNIENVLTRFVAFYRENAEMLTERAHYPESAHHLAFMAWLQRIVNGGGYIRREYAAGLGFIDLMIEYGPDRFVFELKTEKNYQSQAALEQVARYARRIGVSDAYLVVFRRKMTAPEHVGQREQAEYAGIRVHIIWM